MNLQEEDTIYALATPPGKSAIAVIRISGPEASTVPELFSSSCPKVGEFKFTKLKVSGNVIDECILLFMEGPFSSTGEDVCEIQCHGSPVVVEIILERLLKIKGFRPADPGEFTRRGFMNGKMDLTSVEGLADLIEAQTVTQLVQARSQLDGSLTIPIMNWRKRLINLEAKLEASIDFSDEDLPGDIMKDLRFSTKSLIKEFKKVLNDERIGEIVREGLNVTLLGPVNVGKSTILNAISGRPTSIVSDEAGTTRDVVKVKIDLDGIPVTISDTAGLRENVGTIENEGIRRAIEAASEAKLVVIVLDGNSDDWVEQLPKIDDLSKNDKLLVINKVDLIKKEKKTRLGESFPEESILISAKNTRDIDRLISTLKRKLIPHNVSDSATIITRSRHRKSILIASDALSRMLDHNLNTQPELAAEEFRLARGALGRITGEIDVEEVLGDIFSAFCIGK